MKDKRPTPAEYLASRKQAAQEAMRARKLSPGEKRYVDELRFQTETKQREQTEAEQEELIEKNTSFFDNFKSDLQHRGFDELQVVEILTGMVKAAGDEDDD